MSLQRDNRSLLSQELFDALADPTRRAILELLAARGRMSATEIYGNFKMSNPAVSQHLKVLREAEFVNVEKSAQKHIYSINLRTMHSLQDWVKETTSLWDQRFDRLESVLEGAKRKTARRR